MYRFALATLTLALAAPAVAQTVFPPLVSGTYNLGAQAAQLEFDANGDPTTPPTLAISLHMEETPTVQIACTAVNAEGIARFSITLANDGLRNLIRCRAHGNVDCTGLESPASANRAIVFFNGPERPAVIQ